MAFLESLRDVSVIVASLVAIYGINSWRREYRGKKRAELAEEALCLFYEGRDAISHIRSPFTSGAEGKTRKPGENESPEQSAAYDQAYVLFERYNSHIELFNKLYSMRYRFMAQFGIESAAPFEEFRIILNHLIASARSLGRLWAQRNRIHLTEEREKRLDDLIEKQEAFFWEGLPEEDPIAPRVESCINKIETICKPIIAGRETTLMDHAHAIFGKAKTIIDNRHHKDHS
jgi:hypothetical protein